MRCFVKSRAEIEDVLLRWVCLNTNKRSSQFQIGGEIILESRR